MFKLRGVIMKKIFRLLFTMVLTMMLFGCENKQDVNMIAIDSFDVDMSGYLDMNSVNHHFKGITPEEFIRVINEDGSGVFYIGYTNCGSCQNSVAMFEEAAEATDTTVYYLNVYPEDGVYDFFASMDELTTILDPILRHDDGEPVIYTPHLIALVNGEFKDSLIGGGFTIEDVENLMNEVK